MIGAIRLTIALPIFLLASLLNLLAVCVGGERFASIYLDTLKKRVAEL